jgi:hypothetical protein
MVMKLSRIAAGIDPQCWTPRPAQGFNQFGVYHHLCAADEGGDAVIFRTIGYRMDTRIGCRLIHAYPEVLELPANDSWVTDYSVEICILLKSAAIGSVCD